MNSLRAVFAKYSDCERVLQGTRDATPDRTCSMPCSRKDTNMHRMGKDGAARSPQDAGQGKAALTARARAETDVTQSKRGARRDRAQHTRVQPRTQTKRDPRPAKIGRAHV